MKTTIGRKLCFCVFAIAAALSLSAAWLHHNPQSQPTPQPQPQQPAPATASPESEIVYVTFRSQGRVSTGAGGTIEQAAKRALPSGWGEKGTCSIAVSSDVPLEHEELRAFFYRALRSLALGMDPPHSFLSSIPRIVAIDLKDAKIRDGALPPELFKWKFVEEVVLPDGLVEISREAFSGCYRLASVRIPDSVVSIDKEAFAGCGLLESILLPETVRYIGAGAFRASGLKSFSIPRSITSIEDDTFNHSQYLERISIPDSVTSIGRQAFTETPLREVEIPWSVVSIENGAFRACRSLERISIAGMGNSASSGNRNSRLERIENEAFSYCFRLVSIALPDSVSHIGWKAFEGCTSLAEVALPKSLQTLEKTFEACRSLREVVLPDSLRIIGSNAFAGCASLQSVDIPPSVATIVGGAFSNCSSLRSIAMPDSVTSIGQHAFAGCSSLVSAKMSNAISVIPYGAFMNCAKLTSVSLPKSLATIERSAFAGCLVLASLSLPDSIREIDLSAFDQTSVGSLTVPEDALVRGEVSSQVSVTRRGARDSRANAVLQGKRDDVFSPSSSRDTQWFSNLPERDKIALALPLKISTEISARVLLLPQGGSQKLMVKVIAKGTEAFETRNGKWSTSDPRVATVDKNGLVRAIGPGSALVVYGAVAKATLKDASGGIRTIDDWPVFASCRVTVR